MTKEEFLANPLRVWWSFNRPLIEDEWLAQAWESDARFRDEATYEFQREASKIGTLEFLYEPLVQLKRALPLLQIVELYHQVRAHAPWREPEFRPEFERVLGEDRMATPQPLSRQEIDEQVEQLIKQDEEKNYDSNP